MTPRPFSSAANALGRTFRQQWELVCQHPEMREAFNRSLSQLVPYSGTIEPNVQELAVGHCRVSMPDRPGVRNHLNSIHAIALANLAELASGLTILYSAPEACRSIIIGFEIRYLKKARGTITAECRWEAPKQVRKAEHGLEVNLFDEVEDKVAAARVYWLLGPIPAASRKS